MPITSSEALLVGFDEEMASTRKLIECLPDQNFDFKPHPKSMTLGRLAGHVVEMPGWVSDTIEQNTLSVTPEEGKPTRVGYVVTSREEALSKFDSLAKEARELLEKAEEEHLGQPWSLTFNQRVIFSRPRSEVLRIWFINHLIHHRGQLGVYLRLLDIPIPGMYGPSADTRAQLIAQFQ